MHPAHASTIILMPSLPHPRVHHQVTSPLHRQQLLRAMQRQLLGLGSPPGRLSHLHCKAQHAAAVLEPAAASAAASADASADHQQQQTGNNAPTGAAAAVLCSWKPPADAGQPGMHKYVLQRIELSAAATAWQTVAELHDSLSVRFRDTPPTPGVYQYRLSVSVWVRSPACTGLASFLVGGCMEERCQAWRCCSLIIVQLCCIPNAPTPCVLTQHQHCN